jgi:hypothetical protein
MNKCDATESQILRRLKTSGCSNPDLKRLSYPELCKLNAVYNDTVIETKTKIPSSDQVYFDAEFALTNLAYLRYSAEQVQECKIELESAATRLNNCFETKESFQRCLFPRVASARDLEIQTQFHCILRDIIERSTNFQYHNVPKSKSRGIKAVTELLHRFIDPIKLISTGQFSKVYLGSLRKFQAPFVIIKTSNNEKSVKYVPGIVLHELAVGYALNTIRRFTGSSFTYFYGGFYCGATTGQYATSLSQNKPDTAFVCEQTLPNVTSFSIQQLIPQGVTLSTLLTQLKTETSSSRIFDTVHHVFIQVAQALWVAQHELKFMHFDLHGNNVLITPTAPYDLKFTFGGRDVHQVTSINSFVTLIDYGHSVCTAKMNNQQKEVEVVLNNCWPIDDPKKNVMLIGARAKTTNDYFLPLLDLFRYITFAIAVNWGKVSKHVDTALVKLRSVWLTFIKQTLETSDMQQNRYVKWVQTENMSAWVDSYFSQNIGFVLVEDAPLMKLATLEEWMANVTI